MPARYRERTRGSVSGGGVNLISPTGANLGQYLTGGSGTSWKETCDDSTQPRPYINDQPLLIVDKRAEPIRFNGTMPWSLIPGYTWEWADYNPTNRSLFQYCPTQLSVNWLFWQTKALASMNPSRPIVDLPLFTFELKDFPHMLRQVGDAYRKGLRGVRFRDVPEWHLAYSFGWAPLVSDLWSLVNLAKSIEKRKAYLKALEYGTHVRRTLFKEREVRMTHTEDGLVIDLYLPTPIKADVDESEVLKVWFTANAKLRAELSDVTQAPEYGLLQGLGLNLSAETLWNAVPWSWLIDYFANVGDFLAAQRGYMPLEVTRMCIMATQKVESRLTRIRCPVGIEPSGSGRLTTIVKQRAVITNPTPFLTYDPFLSGSQVAILGSLLTSKSLKGIK